MADSHANKCSSNSDLIPLPNLSQVTNLNDEMENTDRNGVLPPKSKLQLTWTGDFASLKQFVADVMKLQGSWSQPGGDRKVFSGDLFSITWRKGKKILKFEGKESDKVKRLFCMELCGAQNSTQASQTEQPVNMCYDARSCNCNGLSVDMEGIKLEQVIMERDIKVNNCDLANLSEIVGVLRSEVLDVRQRLDKHDENMNLNLHIPAERSEGLALSQHCSNRSELDCIDRSTQTIDHETKTIEIEYAEANQHITHCSDSTVDIINDQNLNNSIIFMHDTTPLALETKDNSIMEIYQPHEELTPKATLIDSISRERHNLTQRKTHAIDSNRQCTKADGKNLHQSTLKHPSTSKMHPSPNKTPSVDWLNKLPLIQSCVRGKNTIKPRRVKHDDHKQYYKHKQQFFRKYEQRHPLQQPPSLKERLKEREWRNYLDLVRRTMRT